MGREIQRVIVDRAFQRGGFESYADLAERVGVSAPTLSQWRQGINPIPERRLEQLCNISGDDVGVFRLAIMAEETKIVSLRKSIEAVLRDAGRKLPTTAAGLLLLTIGALYAPQAGARVSDAQICAVGAHHVCIMRNIMFTLHEIAFRTAWCWLSAEAFPAAHPQC